MKIVFEGYITGELGQEHIILVEHCMQLYDNDFRIDYWYSLKSKQSLPTIKIKTIALLFYLDPLSIQPKTFCSVS